MKILESVLGFEMELEAQEKNVGPFRADILCKNTYDNSWVLIENQLERTDHTHLGQILTYAAGLQAVTIIWITKRFSDEHRATLDWLNEITDDRFQFFGLEVELWKIGNSPAAPRFNVVSKPNNWSRSISAARRKIENEELTETKKWQLEYWTSFSEHLLSQNSPIKPQTPRGQHWANFAIGRTGFLLMALLNSRENRISVGFQMVDNNAKAYFNLLYRERDIIEQELGFDLDWRELPDNKESQFVVHGDGKDLTNAENWPKYHFWMKKKLEKIDSVLRPRVKELDANEWYNQENNEVVSSLAK